MEFIKKVPQHLRRALGFMARLRKEDGLINTTDLLVATGATVILATGVGSTVLGTLDDSKYGKAQPDAQAIASALSQFFADTGKWPGQAEQAALADGDSETAGVQLPARFLVTTLDADWLPTNYNSAVSITAATCQNNSLQGFVGKSIQAGSLGVDASNLLDINDYLVRKPDEASYPNWKGPYIQAEIKTDPWDRAWVLNLQPLYCSETIADAASGSADTDGNIGYAWLLTGGGNRTISTSLSGSNLDATGDDAGMNLGKLVTRGEGGLDANGS